MMALKVKLQKLSCTDDDEMLTVSYLGEDDGWAFYVDVPKGQRPTTADVHFEFEDEETAEVYPEPNHAHCY